MGVYISDMELPKSCYECPLTVNCEDCEGYEWLCLPLSMTIGYAYDYPDSGIEEPAAEKVNKESRRNDCPLIDCPGWDIVAGLEVKKRTEKELENSILYGEKKE